MAKINHEIHDKLFLAIINAFEDWGDLFKGVQDMVTIYIDHKNLEHFMNGHVLNHHQARWNMFLNHFNFIIVYCP